MRKMILLNTFLVLLAMLVAPAKSGVIRHDVDSSKYESLGQAYESVGRVGVATLNASPSYFGSGTLIHPRWVLTAAHLVGEQPMMVSFDGRDYEVASHVTHPGWNGRVYRGHDLALLELTDPVSDITPYGLGDGASALGDRATFVGWGRTGNGLAGATEQGGLRRAGHNVLDETGDDFWPLLSSDLLMADFDYDYPLSEQRTANTTLGGTAIPTMLANRRHINRMGEGTPDPLEYLPGPGDSGGGVFVERHGIPVLAGVISFNLAWDGSNNAGYTDMVGVIDLSVHRDWIESHVPEPATGLLMGAWSLVALASRRKHHGKT